MNTPDNLPPAGGFVVVRDVGAMDIKSPALQIRYGADYLDGWNSCRDAILATAQPSAKDGVRGELTLEQEGAVAKASREQLLAEREEALKDYVSDYEMIGEDEEGRDGCYQPTEHERFLIEDAIRGWDALELPEIATTASGLVDAFKRVRETIRGYQDAEYLAMDADGKTGLGEYMDAALQSVWPGEKGEGVECKHVWAQDDEHPNWVCCQECLVSRRKTTAHPVRS